MNCLLAGNSAQVDGSQRTKRATKSCDWSPYGRDNVNILLHYCRTRNEWMVSGAIYSGWLPIWSDLLRALWSDPAAAYQINALASRALLRTPSTTRENELGKLACESWDGKKLPCSHSASNRTPRPWSRKRIIFTLFVLFVLGVQLAEWVVTRNFFEMYFERKCKG